MHAALSDIATWMASMAEMKKINNVVVYNPMDPIGLIDDDSDERSILQLWGADQVHPTEAAYQLIAKHLIGFIDTHTARWRRQVQKRLVQNRRLGQNHKNLLDVNPGYQEWNQWPREATGTAYPFHCSH
jgi:hypothetical protein